MIRCSSLKGKPGQFVARRRARRAVSAPAEMVDVAFRKRWCAAPARQSPAHRAQALSSDRLASPWRRDRPNDALVELADVTLAKNARDGLVAIIADLTARQVPGALTLQERVMQLR